MRFRKLVWGGIFGATIVFTVTLVADILTNKAAIASSIYNSTQIGTVVPAEILFCAALSLPVIAAVSGIMFLRYFIKARKQQVA